MQSIDLKPLPNDFDKNARDFDILRGIIVTKKLSGLTQSADTNKSRSIKRAIAGELPNYLKLKRKYPDPTNRSHLSDLSDETNCNIKLWCTQKRAKTNIFTTGDDYAITANFKLKSPELEGPNGDWVTLSNLRLLVTEPVDNAAIEWRCSNSVKYFTNFNDLINYKMDRP